jgi:spore coat protein CotH
MTKWRGRLGTVGLAVVVVGYTAGCDGDSASGWTPTDPVPTTDSTPEQRASVLMFDEGRIHEVKIQMSEEDWQSILDDSRGDELRIGTVSIDGVTATNVGIRPAGESSRVPGNAKMSMRVEFDAIEDNKRMGGFDEIKLTGSWDDPFIVRDRLGYWVYRQVMHAPRIVATRIAVNGQDRGIYEIEEVWGKESLQSRFADADGPLYRIRGLTNLDPYEYKGLDAAAYVPLPWDPKGMRDPADHAVIGQTLRVLTEEPQRIGEVMDVDTLLTYFAVSAIVANTDGFTGPFEVDDHFQYFDPTTNRFVILPWDPDNTFGSINDLPDADIFLNYNRSLVTRMVSTGQLREAFLTKLEDVMNRVPAEAILAKSEAFAAEIRATVEADTTKMYPTSSFEWSLGYIRDWTNARYASIRSQIAAARGVQPPVMAP